MDFQQTKASSENFKIICKNYPSEFFLDKNVAKEYFRQFGKLRRLTFKPKLRICTVEYVDKDGYLNALNNAGEYNGMLFQVQREKSPEKKKKIKGLKPIWRVDNEVEAELLAMGGGFNPNTIFGQEMSESVSDIPKVDKTPKLKRSWLTETQLKVKKKPKSKENTTQKVPSGDNFPDGDGKQMELVTLIKSQAFTIEEKYRILDARDKLIRIKLKRKTNLKSSPTIGTCPDMCPEKERLMRETQHQVALYEQEDNGRSMNPSKAIKQYSRSSADQETPLPHELRPVIVLQMTMAYLMHNIIDICESNDVNLAEWYHFMWDRTRGIRKDITQQELCSRGAVELIEQCARFHIHCSARLVAEDPSVFDQKINTENLTKCLQSLKYMYHDLELKGERCPNEAEFRAYIILLNLNDGNFMWEVQELREDIQKSKEVKFALEVYSALDKSNYVKFFKLVYSTTYLNACILMRYFVQVRVTAIKTLLKCYTSRAFRSVYPLQELKQLLAFDDIESTVDFMQAYGVSINEDRNYIMLEKNTFMVPELPYQLDRSLNIVESKRTFSVGKIVCGKELPPKTFNTHVPQNSFDQNGHLVLQDLLEESDLDQTEMEFSEDVEVSPVVIPKSTDRSSESSSVPNIFAQKGGSVLPMKEISSGSFFSLPKEEPTPGFVKQPFGNIFSQSVDTPKSIFAKQDTPVAPTPPFDAKPSQTSTFFKDEVDATHRGAQEGVFGSAFQKVNSLFAKPEPTPFTAAPKVEAPPTSVATSTQPKKGGFYFELPKTTQEIDKSKMFHPPSQDMEPTPSVKKFDAIEVPQEKPFVDEMVELQRKKEEELERRRKELEDMKKREELERKRLEDRKEEEERLRKIKKQKQEEELRRRMELLRREEEKRKEREIRESVKSVLTKIVTKVEDEICRERLETIKKRVQRRMLLRTVQEWRQIVVKNKRKRKAMDCSPVWINTKTLEQSAEELHTVSQDLTLMLRKRYKYGKSLEIDIAKENKIKKIDLFELTYPTLNQRFFNLKGTLQKHIFWKVEISLPDHYELRNGLTKIEQTLKDAFWWEDRNGTIMAIEQTQPNPSQSVTYCVERQRGLYVRYADSNGIIFVAKDFNSLLQRRILENLKELGVFTKVPIVIILQEYDEKESKLKGLIEENIVSDYLILIQNITPKSLVSLIQEGLVFLASKVEKPPPLELDTLLGFLKKHLCTEIWKRANSFAKWNSHYKSCLRNPNIVISLYNEALSKLEEIVLDKSCFEYPNFPDVFKEYLQNEIPDFLPCNYCYFPKFWKNEAYIHKLEKVLKSLSLPKWTDKWPPSNEFELEINLSKYCTKIFKEPEKTFYKIMSVLLKEVDPNSNFEDVEKVLWSDIIEVLALEKLNDANLSLSGTPFENKSIFNQLVVVYDVITLETYNKSDWFYLTNPMIKKQVEKRMKEDKVEVEEKNEVCVDLATSIDLDKTIEEVTNKLANSDNRSKLKRELAEFTAMMNDLESCIEIHKKISSKIEENLRRAITEN